MDVTSFRIAVPEAELEDLRARVRAARWPEPETVDDWSQGVPLDWLRALCAHWADGYDWRRVEAELNAVPQVRAAVDGLGVHVLLARSPVEDALPVVMTHGWPGSVIEFLDVLGPLTDPAAHGGDADDAFHVVCPSLPGYGFSDKPTAPGWGVDRIAAAWAALMAGLGFERYGAHGSDWGTSVSAALGRLDPEHVAGLHLVPPLAGPGLADEPTEPEARAMEDLEAAADWESGYSHQHATRPQTIGYSLTDSPVGLCAWIAEKFRAWTDGEDAVARDRVLDTVTLYWLTRSGASSARLYWESSRDVNAVIAGEVLEPVDVPVSGTVFPAELQRPSRRWAARRFRDLRHWGEPPRGGHFPALEQPGLFVDEVRAAFRSMR
jgi:epoxide hydrolase